MGRLKKYPLGALSGLAAAGALSFFAPELTPDGWLEAPFALSFVVIGMAVEGLLHWGFGWYVDPKLKELKSEREATLKLDKVARHEQKGNLSHAEAQRIRARIATRDVVGDPAPRGPRGHYKKKSGLGPPPALPPGVG